MKNKPMHKDEFDVLIVTVDDSDYFTDEYKAEIEKIIGSELFKYQYRQGKS